MKKASLYLFLLLISACNVEIKQEAMVETLLEADLAFSDMSREKGMNQAFIKFCAKEAVLLRQDAMPLKGAASIAESLSHFNDSAFTLTWKPLHAMVAKSGELGYTYGTFTMIRKETGASSRGTYVSVWIKEDQSWKWVLDSGNEGLGDQEPEE